MRDLRPSPWMKWWKLFFHRDPFASNCWMHILTICLSIHFYVTFICWERSDWVGEADDLVKHFSGNLPPALGTNISPNISQNRHFRVDDFSNFPSWDMFWISSLEGTLTFVTPTDQSWELFQVPLVRIARRCKTLGPRWVLMKGRWEDAVWHNIKVNNMTLTIHVRYPDAAHMKGRGRGDMVWFM